jgi:hypothetical protein
MRKRLNFLPYHKKQKTMKKTTFILVLLAALTPLRLPAPGIAPFTNLDTYIERNKSFFIGRCLPAQENPLFGNVVSRKMRVLAVLRGNLKVGDNVMVLLARPIVSDGLYLIAGSSEGPDEKGNLRAYNNQPGATEIQLWGEITKTEQEQRIANFFKSLEGRTLKEKLLRIFEMRRSQLKSEEKERQEELDALEKALDSK